MAARMLFFVLSLLVSSGAAQSFIQNKDLGFAQVAAGDTVEAVLTVTNRGTNTYQGFLVFRSGQAEIWNPVVNGSRVANGELNVAIDAGATGTFRVTDSGLHVGAAAFLSVDFTQRNVIEGNLTYFIRSGSILTDSIGVPPSVEFYKATIPFEEFSTIALALANGDYFFSETATVVIRLRNDSGTQIQSTTFNLVAEAQRAQFLSELFPTVPDLGRGRVDIESRVPILGTAVTLKNGQISTLPLVPSPTVYSVRTTSSLGTTSVGELSMWADGFFIKGLLRITTVDNQPVSSPSLSFVGGRLNRGVLRISFYSAGEEFFGEEVNFYAEDLNFSFLDTSSSGTWVLTFLSDNSTITGTFDLTRLN